jgi:hypothetical protein
MTFRDKIVVIQAAATWVAVAVALFREPIQRWWNRPRLRIHVRCSPPHCHRTFLGETPAYYYRLWVENFGRTPAEDVEVVVANLRRLRGEVFSPVPAFLPMNIRWSNFEPPTLFVPRIGPSLGRHCDLGHVLWPPERVVFPAAEFRETPRDQTLFQLDLAVAPNTGTHLLQPGIYLLDAFASARGTKTVIVTVRILLSGTWYEDGREMFAEGAFIAPWG